MYQNVLFTLAFIIFFQFQKNCLGQKSLIGSVYRNKSELPQLKGFQNLGGAVIDNSKNESLNFSVSYLKKGSLNLILFEKIIKIKGINYYSILDTIHIINYDINYIITFSTCRVDDKRESSLIALVKFKENKKSLDKVVKCWIADVNKCKIFRKRNLKGITCLNENYGI